MEQQAGERIGHIAVNYQGFMLVWGGYNGYNDDLQTNYLSPEELWIYDPLIEKWTKKICSGETNSTDLPPGTSGAASCIINDFLYLFGGYHDEGNSHSLYRLDLNKFTWKLLEPSGYRPLPCDKSVCWEYNNKLFIFAGYGCAPNARRPFMRLSEQRDYNFVLDVKSHWHYKRGWNNQFACYDPVKNEWSWPRFTGSPPIARAAHAVAKVGSKVFIHGGRHGHLRMGDLYFIDMDTMSWSQQLNVHDSVGDNVPEGRSWHSFTPISNEAIVLYGGFSQNNEPLNDCWLFHIPTFTWIRIDLPFNKPRLWHTATESPYGEILVFGGGRQNILHNLSRDIYAGDVITLRFTPKSLLRLSLDAVISHSHQLQKHWSHLPINIQKLLDRRQQSIAANSAGS